MPAAARSAKEGTRAGVDSPDPFLATGADDGLSVPVALRTLLLVPRLGAADAVAPNVFFAFSVVFPVVLCVPPREAAADETTRTSPAVLPNVLPMTAPPASDAAPGLPVLALVASPEGVKEAPSLPDAVHAALSVARPGAVDVVVRKLAVLVPVKSSVALPVTSPPGTDATPNVPVLPPVVCPVGVDAAPTVADAWPVDGGRPPNICASQPCRLHWPFVRERGWP